MPKRQEAPIPKELQGLPREVAEVVMRVLILQKEKLYLKQPHILEDVIAAIKEVVK
jgi:hypothetical protein